MSEPIVAGIKPGLRVLVTAAAQGIARAIAESFLAHGSRVNAILRGVVEGARIGRVLAARAPLAGISIAAAREASLAKVSLRRMVSPQDVANMALFLASPVGRNVSGQALSVCGNVESL